MGGKESVDAELYIARKLSFCLCNMAINGCVTHSKTAPVLAMSNE